eukprot:TRINITY_DN20851_c0_g1_i1.p1 TRINITY_DN20851_c0_g1~~TRINITY_DN20851_c0_g1_i1.p1  ORF type:complete len:417 (+),score=111.50 TRINITY_DN20851_c0_g1_i1:34-1251(+)
MFAPSKFDCSAKFVEQVLGREVTAVKVSYPPQGWSRGLCRLELEPVGLVPESVVVKYDAVDNGKHNAFHRVLKFISLTIDKSNKREVYFYQNIKKIVQSKGVCTPECFYCDTTDSSFLNVLLDSKTSFLTLILEDLKDYSNYTVATPVPESNVLQSIISLARIHGSCWNNAQLLPEEYKTPPIFSPMVDIKGNVPSFTGMKELIDENAQYLGCDTEQLKEAFSYVIPYYVKVMRYYNYFAYKPDPKARNGKLFQHFTLLHGDYHSGNIFFRPEDKPDLPKDIIHIDWQCYGLGPCAGELMYFLCTIPMDPSGHDELIQTYHEELLKVLEQPAEYYPLEILKEEVEIFLFQATLFAMASMQGFLAKMMMKIDRFKEFLPTVLAVNTIRFNMLISLVKKWNLEGRFN